MRSDYYLYGAYNGNLSRRYSQWFPDASVVYSSDAWRWQHLGISIYGMPRFGFYQPIFDLEYQQQFFHARSLGMLSNMRRPSVHIAVTNRFMIRKVSWVALKLYGQLVNDDGYVESKACGGVNISAFRNFLHDRLTVNCYFNDLFNTDKERWQIRSTYLEISKDCDNLQREVGLRISFQLNTSRSRNKGTGAGTDKKKRL